MSDELAPVFRLDDFRSAFEAEAPVDGEEVWAEVMAAARLFGALREAGLSVRFDVDDPTQPPRVRITDLDGNTVREIRRIGRLRPGRRSRRSRSARDLAGAVGDA